MRLLVGIAVLIVINGCAGDAALPLAPDAIVVDGLAFSTTLTPSTSDAGALLAEMSIQNPGTSERSVAVLAGTPLWVQFRRQSDDSLMISSPAGSTRPLENIVIPAGGVRRVSRLVSAAELATAPNGVYVVSVRLTTTFEGPSVVQASLLSLPLGMLR